MECDSTHTWYSVLALLNAAMMVLSFLMHGFHFARPDGVQALHGVLEAGQDKLFLKDTPALMIVLLACLYQAAWVHYSLALMCKVSPSGSNFLPFPVLFLNAFASLIGVLWLLQVPNHNATLAFGHQLVVFASLLAALIIAFKGLDQMYPAQPNVWDVRHLWMTRVLVHNGLAFQVAWSGALAVINMGLALVYARWLVPWEGAVATMSLIGLEGFACALLDFFILNRWTRYTVSPYVMHLLVCVAMTVWWFSVPAVLILISALILLVLKLSATLSLYSRINPGATAAEGGHGINLDKSNLDKNESSLDKNESNLDKNESNCGGSSDERI